jgi:ketosteroid isomerase-like protein
MKNPDDLTAEIQSVLRTINGTWLSAHPEAVQTALQSCFHREIVVKGCDLETLADGREASVKSYIDFIRRARVSHFEQAEPDIHIFGSMAIASYGWRIVYTLEGGELDEKGSDVFVFIREDGKWLAVWRAMLSKG